MVARSLPRALAAVVPPGVATAAGSLLHPDGTGVPASLYLVGIVVAAAAGGWLSGLGAAALSAVGFVFFFTDPRLSFRIGREEQVVSSLLFVAAALIVGALSARAAASRERAVRSEREALLLARVAQRLVSAESLPRALAGVAEVLVEDPSIVRCAIALEDPEGEAPMRVEAGRPAADGPVVSVPIVADGRPTGSLEATLSAGAAVPAARRAVEAVAAQVGVRQAAERKEARLREARDDARASELRAALFSSVTHDLRTPLASIVAGVTSLRADDGQLDAGRRLELLETVAEEAERLDRLVGNILELARARSGALAPEPARLSPDELLDGVLTRLRPRLEGLRVHRVVREDVPAISADPVLLERAITNVLDNAIAHSPPGGTIHVSAAAFGGGVELRVADEGPGIAPEDRERVFEPFVRGDDAGSGSGLGLAIARAIVAAHAGTIRIQGSPRGGAAVVIRLPAAEGGP
ncbi:MAG: hypothetical protein KatS3mg013_1701 [Actinomycetota bacterium]|nr:MAG: hypothetical protein KatS3mg013_1701 [Actinomycetota bacterium]